MAAKNADNYERKSDIIWGLICYFTSFAMLFVFMYIMYNDNNDVQCDTPNQMQSLKNDLVLICYNYNKCLENTTYEKIEQWCPYVMLLAENMKI